MAAHVERSYRPKSISHRKLHYRRTNGLDFIYLSEIKLVKMKINKKDQKEEEDKQLRKGWRNIKIGQQRSMGKLYHEEI